MKSATQALIGKTITGAIARPASGGAVTVVMLQFSDGSCFEFVSPNAQRALARAAAHTGPTTPARNRVQMSMFPLDGEPAAVAA